MRIVFMSAQQVHHHRRHQRSRQQIRRQHREHDCFCHRHKQVTRHAREEKHGYEDDADGERGNKGRHGNLLRAIENRLFQFLLHPQVSLDVLNFHGGVVYKHTNRERQAAKRHDVEGFADGAQQDDGREN